MFQPSVLNLRQARRKKKEAITSRVPSDKENNLEVSELMLRNIDTTMQYEHNDFVVEEQAMCCA